MREKRDGSPRLARIINSLISSYQEVISHATAGDVRLELGNCPLYRLHRPLLPRGEERDTRVSKKGFLYLPVGRRNFLFDSSRRNLPTRNHFQSKIFVLMADSVINSMYTGLGRLSRPKNTGSVDVIKSKRETLEI